MKSIFIQAAEHRIVSAAGPVCLDELPDLIRKHTDWDYSYTQTDAGCCLKPTFRNMPYRNSFVPEIDVVISRNEAQEILHMQGQPVRFVRVFMSIWFGFALLLEVFLLSLAFTSNLDKLFPVFVPVILCTFGYLLCELATRATFKAVIQAIEKELAT